MEHTTVGFLAVPHRQFGDFYRLLDRYEVAGVS